jgi:hypothetical protein
MEFRQNTVIILVFGVFLQDKDTVFKQKQSLPPNISRISVAV